jgi:hypothetical protein
MPTKDLACLVAAVRAGAVVKSTARTSRASATRAHRTQLRIARVVFLAITAIFLHGAAFHAWSHSPTDVSSAEELRMSTKMRLLAAAVGGVVLSGASSAHAQDAVQWRVEDGGNGHWYALLPNVANRVWSSAQAEATVLNAMLASISSAQEFTWIRDG